MSINPGPYPDEEAARPDGSQEQIFGTYQQAKTVPVPPPLSTWWTAIRPISFARVERVIEWCRWRRTQTPLVTESAASRARSRSSRRLREETSWSTSWLARWEVDPGSVALLRAIVCSCMPTHWRARKCTRRIPACRRPGGPLLFTMSNSPGWLPVVLAKTWTH